jgi:hypothetical protein
LLDHGFSPEWRLGRESGRKTAAKPPISGAKVTLSGEQRAHFRAVWRAGRFRQLPEVFRFSCEFSARHARCDFGRETADFEPEESTEV